MSYERGLTAWQQKICDREEVLFESATVYDITPQGDRLIGLVHVHDDFQGASTVTGKAELTVTRPYDRKDIWEVL